MKLLIVESPGKVQKIQSFLGSDWKVTASVGHVRDLPEKELGVAAPDFTPHYVPTVRGKDVLAKLSGMVKSADSVYLATDPDREGEAIAWHLKDALDLKNPKRITYTEITENAVKKAIEAPTEIDMALVHAQEGRRVLDRFCGYMVSSPLSKIGGTKLSAGRVQSPAVRLVVEREREIANFKPTRHFGVELTFECVDTITDGWKATWISKPWLEDGQEYFQDKALAEKIASLRVLDVVDYTEAESKLSPPAPFTTSSLQQAASNALKFSPKHTMELAQKLYEGGHITYMRTDSPNLSQEAVDTFRAYCESQNWPLVEKPRTWKRKEGAQEAHEAVRPTHIEVEEAGENVDEKALYALIRLRTLATQLEDAVFAVRTLKLSGSVDGKEALFEAKGRTLLSSGWKVLLTGDDTEEKEVEPDNPVPAMKAGTKATAIKGVVQEKKTKPAARYTEASLVKELEKRGIGRPSTFAAILDTIQERGYVKQDKRNLVPTPVGELVVDKLKGNFAFIDYDYTKKMEDKLDDIAENKTDYQSLVSQVYKEISVEVDAFLKAFATPCPECGSLNLRHLVKKADKKDTREWDFFACPDCEANFYSDNGKVGAKQVKKEKPPVSKFTCPLCKKPLVRRQGTNTKGEYDFFGCSGYPNCKAHFEVLEDGSPDFEQKK